MKETAKRILTHFDNAEYEDASAMIMRMTGTPRLIADPIAITLGIANVREHLEELLDVLFVCYGFNL